MCYFEISKDAKKLNYLCELEIDSLAGELANLLDQIDKVPRIYFKIEQAKFSIVNS